MGIDDQTAKVPAATQTSASNLDAIVAGLRHSREVTHKIRYQGHVRELPSRDALIRIRDGLFAALFPSHYGCPDLTDETIDYFVGLTLTRTLAALTEQVRRGLLFLAPENKARFEEAECAACDIVRDFAAQLPAIRTALVGDVKAAYSGDPAATSLAEVLLCYPGIRAVIHHRLAHALYKLGAPLVPRLLASISQTETAIDIHPEAKIGPHFFIDHGIGVVIGQTTVIGENVRLYQHVTLGAKSFTEDETGALVKGEPRHPIIEDNVVIYAGATILGRVTVGRDSVIGGNVWLTRSVPPGSFVSQAQNRLADSE
ncbi:serine O-acetyltransferase EpsC [Acidocella aminolytica]|jgi:serine O-acetyltransferase|uniref:serine O-acetyltransferase n=1 Tax=Acidocella aminolytica 101 = DSM 11237 TaxID=1120923 RepID=A0A0D6PER4_9PROT|nr:serine O-acetyltransferase EpsC [Acidocella aminolytica]GAN80152.1 serine acetyltransferase [Acidocella aminolytica 101 = DSM 11237]GBQ41989.1 serine acetyltransferase [Acidocella aminolytica 101 = DSM 11237]SHE87943.1 serine O-acetyltransferase [Acidocella aminolytica 101 = DSM 11237]